MPYKERDAFHRALRAYLKEVSPRIAKRSSYLYRSWILKVGELTGYKDPRSMSLRDMVLLEGKANWGETTAAVMLATYRAFLRWTGNRDAQRWKIQARQRPKADGIFLSKAQIAACQCAAERLGMEHGLILSLAMDNGLRVVDMQRLTVRNAEQLLSVGQSMIRSKGRRGGKMRLMVMSKATTPLLRDYMMMRRELTKAHGQDPALLLIRADKSRGLMPLSYWVIKNRIIAVSKLSGIYFRPHDGRRTFGHRHHLEGTDLETIAALMGHERVDQTFRSYIGITAEEMRQAQDSLYPMPPIQSVSTP